MAGNNSVLILRGSRTAIVLSDLKLLDGQLLYNTTDNYLTVGGANSKLKLFNLFNCFPLIEEVV